MALTDKLDRTYTLTASTSKNSIINVLKDRVEEANKKNSWFSFEKIDYRKIKVDDHRAVIRYNPDFLLGNAGMGGAAGFIIVRFAANGASTIIIAEVKLIKWPFWVLAIVLVLFSVLLVFLTKGMGKLISLAALWTILLGSTYINVTIYRFLLKRYLIAVLADIGIQEALIRKK